MPLAGEIFLMTKAGALLILFLLFSSCASVPEARRNKLLVSRNPNESNYEYCGESSCINAFCVGQKLSEECSFKGDEDLRAKLFKVDSETAKLAPNNEKLWNKYCGRRAGDYPKTKAICHEGLTMKKPPLHAKVIQEGSMVTTKRVNGKTETHWRQVFVLE
jgi:hypothetical protein